MKIQTTQGISARNVLIAIFSVMAQKGKDDRGGRYPFRAHNYEIQLYISRLQRGHDILDVFVFAEDDGRGGHGGRGPFSPVLEESFLFVIRRYDQQNPEEFFVEDAAQRRYRTEIEPALSDREKAEIDEIASVLLQMIAERNAFE